MLVVIIKILITTSRSRNAIKRIAAISSDADVAAATDNSNKGFFARYVCDWNDYSTLTTPSLFVAMFIIVWVTLFSWRGIQ